VAQEVKETHNMLRDQIVGFSAEARRWVLERNEGTATTFYESRLVDETAGGAKDIPAGRTCHPGPR